MSWWKAILIGVGIVLGVAVLKSVEPSTLLDRLFGTPSPPVEVRRTVPFFDSGAFDRQLADLLAEAPREVVLEFHDRFTLNAIPRRLDAWFTVIQESGGRVTAQPAVVTDTMARRGLGTVVEVAFTLVPDLGEVYARSRATAYDARIEFRQGTGTVERIVLRHR